MKSLLKFISMQKYNEINLLIIENNISEVLLEYRKKNVIDENFDDFVRKIIV